MAKPSRENKASAAAPQRAAHGAPDAAGKASHGGRPRLANTAPTGYASTRALGGAAAAACLAAVIIVCIRHPLPLFDRALAAPPPAEPAAPARCLAVGVLSASGNRAARDAIRSTWQTHPDVCRLHYYIALPQHPMILSQLHAEAVAHGDLVLVHVAEHYRNITHQTLEIMKVASADPAVTHVLKVDDDSFLRLDQLRPVLDEVDQRFPQRPFYLGYMETGAPPIRDARSKWFMSHAAYPPDVYPRFAHGAGYVVSAGLARSIAGGGALLSLGGDILELEDVSVGIWVDHLVRHVDPQITLLHSPRFSFTGMCQDSDLVTHYAAPQAQRCLWEGGGRCAGCFPPQRTVQAPPAAAAA